MRREQPLFEDLAVVGTCRYSDLSLSQQTPGSMTSIFAVAGQDSSKGCVSDCANPVGGIHPAMHSESRAAWLAGDALGGRGLDLWADEGGSCHIFAPPRGQSPRGRDGAASFAPVAMTRTDSFSSLPGSVRSLGSVKWPSSPQRDASPVHYQAFDSVRGQTMDSLSVLSLGSLGSYKWQSSLLSGGNSPVHFQAYDSIRGQTMDSLSNVGISKPESSWSLSDVCSDRLSQDSAPHNSGASLAQFHPTSWMPLQPASWASLQLASVQPQWERGIPGAHNNLGKGAVMGNAAHANGAGPACPHVVTPCLTAQHQLREEEEEEYDAGDKRRCFNSHDESTVSKRATPGNTPPAGMDGSKNKNCHYCEHAPKRTSFFACSSCEQAFCENCNSRHLRAPTYFTGQADATRAAWLCPICSQKCCCTLSRCDKNHLHCKRYRRKLKTIKGALALRPPQGALGVAFGRQDSL